MYNVPKGKISQFIFLALPLVNFLNKNLAVLSHDNTKKIRITSEGSSYTFITHKVESMKNDTSYKAFYLKLRSIYIHATWTRYWYLAQTQPDRAYLGCWKWFTYFKIAKFLIASFIFYVNRKTIFHWLTLQKAREKNYLI